MFAKMQSVNIKMQNGKSIFLLFSVALLSGCVQNFDMRQAAQESKLQEHKIASFENVVSSAGAADETDFENKEPVKLLFVGDMMFDRHVREAVGKYGSGDYNHILESLKEKLSEYDLIVGNLEGPITENESVSIDSKMGESRNFVFTFAPEVAKVLFDNNIKLVNLGNNHILNQGEKGVQQTKKYLNEAGVEYFDEGSTFVKDNIALVSYNYSIPDSENAAIENIKSAKEKSDIVIVSPHWGTEYKIGDPGASVRALAHRFVEAGADIVIGTHPHVVQASEEYNGKKIYYSLGNFVFDQYFQPETMEGLGVELTINPNGEIEYSEVKFAMTKRGQTVFKSEP